MIWIGPGEYPYRVGPFPNAPHMKAITAASSPIPEGIDFTPGWVRTSSGWLPFRNPADPTELWIYENPASRKAREMVSRESALAITRPRLGVQIEKLDDGAPFISHCPRESFAHADGLVCGDELVSIAGKSVEKLSVDEVISLLRTSQRPTPIAVRRWALSKQNSRAFAVWIGPNNYRYRSRDMESAAPSGKHRVVTDTVIAQVVAFGSAYRWVNTVKGWLPIFNPSDPTEVWVWEPPSSRRSRNMVRALGHQFFFSFTRACFEANAAVGDLPITILNCVQSANLTLNLFFFVTSQRPTEHTVTINSAKLGINIEHINSGPCFVSSCSLDAPAYRAGMRAGDEFVRVGANDVQESKAELVRGLLTKSARPLQIVVQRWQQRPDDDPDYPTYGGFEADDYDDEEDAASCVGNAARRLLLD